MSVSVQKVTEPVVIGEGPHWDDQSQALYFVSIDEKTIHKYVPETGVHTKTKLSGRVSFIISVEGESNHFVVGVERKLLIIKWDGEEGSEIEIVKELVEVDSESPTNRFNDAKVDPKGRLFAGTLGEMGPTGEFEKGKGSLYRLDDRGCVKLCEKIDVSNGLAWDLTEKAFYYVDSLEYKIRRYDYDVETGDISNKRYIFDFKENKLIGGPDGLTIDTEGNLWIAIFYGSCVLKVDPRSGTVLDRVPIPAKQITSVTFGGRNLDTLFVTTASLPIDGEQKPPCGATFMVTGLGVKGHPNVKFKLPSN
ncbi:PREDICTED: regucalcin-like [Papilio polytes]|uniref:regucalcin-like n=1 Tax=Papilio polytes TaxID=76194 RepID=UPI0006760152|nr:PREDICTED: regucalcin-like [Papilio polytes]